MAEISKEMEAKLVEFQQSQEQLQIVMAQKLQVKMQIDEIDSALAALKSTSGKVFKSTGSIIVESDKDSLSKELEEKKDAFSTRLQVLARHEEKIRKRLLELKKELETASGNAPTNAGG